MSSNTISIEHDSRASLIRRIEALEADKESMREENDLLEQRLPKIGMSKLIHQCVDSILTYVIADRKDVTHLLEARDFIETNWLPAKDIAHKQCPSCQDAGDDPQCSVCGLQNVRDFVNEDGHEGIATDEVKP